MRVDDAMTDSPTRVVIEVTNTLQARSVTGYQRFVREIVGQLSGPGSPALDVTVVVWDRRASAYRALDADESRSLREPVRRPSAAPAPASIPLRALGRARRAIDDLRSRRPHPLGLPSDAVFLDIEPAWHDPMARAQLLPRLRADGTTIVTMVADVLPELRPEWFEPRVAAAFHSWLLSHLVSSRLLLAISNDTRDGLQFVADREGVALPPTTVIPLGADFTAGGREAPVALPESIGRYLLVVATIEPRKNHALALDLFARLADSYPDLGLVLVGKRGWLVDGTVERIQSDPRFGDRLIWRTDVPDDELIGLYRNAFLALAPSHAEGLGLPVMEALGHGVATISSRGGALPEAGGALAEYADADDVDAWRTLVARHLDDSAYHEQVLERVRGYRPPTWSAAGQAVRQAVVEARAADAASPRSSRTAS